MIANRAYPLSHQLSTPVTKCFPCIPCKNPVNVNGPSKWVCVFLWKLGAITWEVFDNFFEEIDPDMEWDGNDGLHMMMDWYYMCPNTAYTQFLQGTRDATIRTTPTTMPYKATHAPCDVVPNGGLVQGYANTTATTCNSSLPSGDQAAEISHVEDITMLPAQHGCHTDHQVALDKHGNDILCLLRTKSPASSKAAHQDPCSEYGYNGQG